MPRTSNAWPSPVPFRKALLAWYADHGRDLPWRRDTSLYATIVSEFMLQQTQVDTVLPYFARWMVAFPDLITLATAGQEAVLKQWEGLGYYSRARHLHAAAQAVVAMERAPATAEEWQALPGIGPYTAAAIASIACGEAAAVVDGNVIRVLARLGAVEDEFRGNAEAVKHLTPTARKLIDPGQPGDYNQAIMELGATVCRRQPLCTVCPVAAFCQSGRRGDAAEFPRFAKKTFSQTTVDRLWLEHDGALLLHRNPPSAKRLANIAELPTPAQLGLKKLPVHAKRLGIRKRAIGNQRIEERIHRLTADARLRQRIAALPDLVWVPLTDLETVTLSGPHKRWIAELAE